MSSPSTCSSEVSHAPTFPSPAGARASKGRSLVFGESSLDLLASLDPVGSLLKTAVLSEIEAMTGLRHSWKHSGTPCGRSWFRLLTSGRSISASASGLLPTPTANDAENSGSRNTANSKAHPGVSLTDWVRGDQGRGRLLPTPTTTAYGSNSGGRHEGHARPGLKTMATHGMLPTPSHRDYRSPNAKPYSERGGGMKGEQLPNAIAHDLGMPGRLSPLFVSWMIGLPTRWCDIGDRRLGRSATASSRKSRKSSRVQSDGSKTS